MEELRYQPFNLRSKEEGDGFFNLAKKVFVSIKFSCRETTTELGITRDIDLLASRLRSDGPNDFIYKANVLTHPRLVLEFF